MPQIHAKDSLLTIEEQQYINPLSSLITDYSHKWDERINAYLNSGKTAEEYVSDRTYLEQFNEDRLENKAFAKTKEEGVEMIEEKIKQLDELFMDYSQTSSKPLELYRGIDVPSDKKIRQGLNKAFVSTTTDAVVTRRYQGKRCCFLIYKLAPGIPFISAKKFSRYSNEEEIILPRDLNYTFIEKRKVNKDTEPIFDMLSLKHVYVYEVTMNRENQFYQGWRCHESPIYHLEPQSESNKKSGGSKYKKQKKTLCKNRISKRKTSKNNP